MEIGPGKGALTSNLLRLSDDLIAVELDAALAARWLIPLFEKYPRARLEIADIRTLDPAQIPNFGKRKVLGNLPYNIATHLVLRYAEPQWRRFFSEMIFMLQKEVAERILARPVSKAYGYLSCICQLAYGVEKGFVVTPASFSPHPKVNSMIIRLTPRSRHPADEQVWETIKQFLKVAFRQRRKTLENNLRGSPFDPSSLPASGISPKARAEEIPVEQYLRLVRNWRQASP